LALYYLDTSALVKLYFQEPGTAAMQRLAAAPRARLAISSLGVLEFQAAVRARQRARTLAARAAAGVLEHFRQREAHGLLRQILTEAAFDVAALLLDRHPLRAPDALQLAGCVTLHRTQPGSALYFVCADATLLDAARAEQIPHWNPATGTPAPGLPPG